jgi:hypothetical protein
VTWLTVIRDMASRRAVQAKAVIERGRRAAHDGVESKHERDSSLIPTIQVLVEWAVYANAIGTDDMRIDLRRTYVFVPE